MQVLEKILQEIENEITRSWNFYNNEYRQGLQEAQKIIRSHMADEPVSNSDKLDDEWIPVEENAVMPEQNHTVDITFRNSAGIHVGEAIYKEKGFFYVVDAMDCYCEEEYADVLAWRDRPAPYQPKEEKR